MHKSEDGFFLPYWDLLLNTYQDTAASTSCKLLIAKSWGQFQVAHFHVFFHFCSYPGLGRVMKIQGKGLYQDSNSPPK